MGYASTGAAYSSCFGDSLAFVLGEDAAVSVEAEKVGESVVVFLGEHHVVVVVVELKKWCVIFLTTGTLLSYPTPAIQGPMETCSQSQHDH